MGSHLLNLFGLAGLRIACSAGTLKKLAKRSSVRGLCEYALRGAQQLVRSILLKVAGPLGAAVLEQHDTLRPEPVRKGELVGHVVDEGVLELSGERRPSLQEDRYRREAPGKILMDQRRRMAERPKVPSMSLVEVDEVYGASVARAGLAERPGQGAIS